MDELIFLLTQKESVWLDFKKEFHENSAKLLHDILCLCNADHNGSRYLVFGVKNNKEITGVESDSNKKNNAEIHDFLRQVNLNKIPNIDLSFHIIEGHEVGVLRIENSNLKPYFLKKDYTSGKTYLRTGVVYTRLGDTNIPCNETAPEDHIERMWRERIEAKHIKSITFEDNFPITLDDPLDFVTSKLGHPNIFSGRVAQYFSEGIEISYDQHYDFVESISIYPLISGTAFNGTLLGIKLDDTFPKVREVLGAPLFWGLAYEDSSVAVWKIGDKLLMVRIWSDPNGLKVVPAQQLGRVRSISYCNQKSFIGYMVIVINAIEQIKKGEIPDNLENEEFIREGINFDDPIFSEQYEFLGVDKALLGGGQVFVGFRESKEVVSFWIYPLQWRYPVIRSIIRVDKNPDEISVQQE